MVIQSVLTPKQTDNLYREKLKQKGCNYPNSYDNLEYLLFSDKLDLSGISSKKEVTWTRGFHIQVTACFILALL